MTELNPSTDLASSENNANKTHFQVQRERLGIPSNLSDKPILSLSSHRGLLDARYPSHVEIFRRTLEGQPTENEDRESGYVDLSVATPDQVVDSLREIILREDPSKHGKLLPSSPSNNDPLPEFVTNIVYLPQLDINGDSADTSITFAVDSTNARFMLAELKAFLDDRGILNKE